MPGVSLLDFSAKGDTGGPVLESVLAVLVPVVAVKVSGTAGLVAPTDTGRLAVHAEIASAARPNTAVNVALRVLRRPWFVFMMTFSTIHLRPVLANPRKCLHVGAGLSGDTRAGAALHAFGGVGRTMRR
jgi:hypothetical protein